MPYCTTGLPNNGPRVRWRTSEGNFTILFHGADMAPIAISSILDLVRHGYYDEMFIHRLVPNFGLQFGCSFAKTLECKNLWGRGGAAPLSSFLTPDGQTVVRDRSGNTPRDEQSSLSNSMMSVAVPFGGATGGIAASHLFINFKDNTFLDGTVHDIPRHLVIGRVTDGWEILKHIESLDVDDMFRPVEPIKIIGVDVLGASSPAGHVM